MSEPISIFRRQLIHGFSTALILNGMLASAAPPGWWSDGNPPVIDADAEVENHGVANIGQAKWVARNALVALRAVLPDVAAAVEADLVGTGKPIASWAAPATDGEREKQRAPLLVGQLKAIAAPFYFHLHRVAPQWLAPEMALNGLTLSGTYPWGDDIPADGGNKAPALIGQLKAVFAFDFAADRETGVDADGLPDLWEWVVAGASPTDPWSGIEDINFGNAAAAQAGTGTSASVPGDSDNDGIKDAEDADPADSAISWLKSPESRYAMVELPTLPGGFKPEKLGDGGHVIAQGSGDYSPGGTVFDYATPPVGSTDTATTFSEPSKILLPGSGAWLDLPQSSGQQAATHFFGMAKGVASNGDVVGWAYIGRGAVPHGTYAGTVRWKLVNGSYQSAEKLWTGGPAYTGPRKDDFWHTPGDDSAVDYQIPVLDPPWSEYPRINGRGDIIGHPWWSGGNGPNGGHTAAGTGEGAFVPMFYPKNGTASQFLLSEHAGTTDWGGWRWGTSFLSRGGDLAWSGYISDEDLNTVQVTRVKIAGKADESLASPLAPNALGRVEGGSAMIPDTVVVLGDDGLRSCLDTGGSWRTPGSVIAGKAISKDGTILAKDGKKIWRNGLWTELTGLFGATGLSNFEAIDHNSHGTILAHADRTSGGQTTEIWFTLVPLTLKLHKRGTIASPGSYIVPPTSPNEPYEVVTLENADYDEQVNWLPNSMASASETNRQDGATDAVNLTLDDDFVKINLSCPLPKTAGSMELVMDQAGVGERMQANDLRFYNAQGVRIPLSDLKMTSLLNPQGPLAPVLQEGGLDLFVEIADLGETTLNAARATLRSQLYSDLILKISLQGQEVEKRSRIYRGGFWKNQRTGVSNATNTGTLAFYDGKGRHRGTDGQWKTDEGIVVHGPYAMQSGNSSETNETTPNSGPTPGGWYGLRERTDFRTVWQGSARPQTDHTTDASGLALGYLQQGSYCQWAGPGNRTAFTHTGANPPASIRFKFQLEEVNEFTTRSELQIHPDGFNDGTAGCVGLQSYDDCCRVFFFLRNYFQTRILVRGRNQ